MNGLGFKSQVSAEVEKSRRLKDQFKPSGVFTIEHRRNGKLLQSFEAKNGVVDVGINTALDILFFESQTKISDWYIGLVDASGFSSFASGDTMSSHGGWSEFTSYDETTRQNWEPDAASSKSISNSTASQFSINSSGTLKGIFVSSDNTKSGTSGILWATAAFSSNISVVNGDTLKVTYTVSAS